MISNSSLIVRVNKMDKIAKIEFAKKTLLFVFVLIATFSLLMLLGRYFIDDMSSSLSTSTYFILGFVMIISAIVVKYLGELVIVAVDKDRENKN